MLKSGVGSRVSLSSIADAYRFCLKPKDMERTKKSYSIYVHFCKLHKINEQDKTLQWLYVMPRNFSEPTKFRAVTQHMAANPDNWSERIATVTGRNANQFWTWDPTECIGVWEQKPGEPTCFPTHIFTEIYMKLSAVLIARTQEHHEDARRERLAKRTRGRSTARTEQKGAAKRSKQ